MKPTASKAKGKPTTSGGGVPTNYGYGTFADGTKITFIASDTTHAELQTPEYYTAQYVKGKAIVRDSAFVAVWRFAQ